MEYRIIERDEVGYVHGSGWGERPQAYEVFVHYPGAKAPPASTATLEQDLEYARYLDEIGYQRFKDADLNAEGIDAWPGDPGAGVSYSLLFPKSGRIIRGHDPKRQSSHTKGHNFQGMGYCILVSEGEEANQAQLDAVVWAVNEQVRRGELARPVITGGHRDVFATICPTDKVYAQIPALRARVEGGTTVARRAPTLTDLKNLVQNQINRGFEHYCTPYTFEKGICPSHGGTNPHAPDSRHRKGRAIDFGWPGAAISNNERIHVLLEMDRLRNDPDIDWRMLFNIADNNHPDHGHVDDGEFLPGFDDDVRDRQQVMARDGIDLFVSPRAFPNHIPPTNREGSFRLVDGVAAQKAMARLINPKTGKPFYTGAIDGYLGSGSRAAARAVQDYLDIEVDGNPGPGTIAAIEKALATPAPAPTPEPTLAERVAKYRVSGSNAGATAVAASKKSWPAGKGLLLYRRDTPDGEAAMLACIRAGEGTTAFPVNADGSLPSAVKAYIPTFKPAWLMAIGGSVSVSDKALSTALTAAGIKH